MVVKIEVNVTTEDGHTYTETIKSRATADTDTDDLAHDALSFIKYIEAQETEQKK